MIDTTRDTWDGRPENPERDGWHWVTILQWDDAPVARYWQAATQVWGQYRPLAEPSRICGHWRYLGPALPPAQVAAAVQAERACKDAAYEERNRVVALLAAVFPSVRTRTAIEGWSDDWHGCVYVTLPTGQASWHYHDSQAHLFAHVPAGPALWDGHTTDEKYDRVAAAIRARGSSEQFQQVIQGID
jgi:hypothetical protein